MDKEKIVTVFIGLLVGIVLASAYFLSAKFLPGLNQKPKQDSFTTKQDNKKVLSQNKENQMSIELLQPDDHSSTTDGTVTVNGKSRPGQQLVIFSNADEKAASTSADGSFTATIKLEEGGNEISINAIDQDGKVLSVKRNVVMDVTL